MKVPNGFFGNGPGSGDDGQNQRDLEAYNINRLQMTVATSTFAGIALVGMFCSCLWFACCRNSSSKTRKKGRTWATASNEAGLHHSNPYSYDGYLDSQGYMQMGNGMDDGGCIAGDGVAPYISNPLYHPNPLHATDIGFSSAYDFNDHYGLGLGGKSQPMLSLASEGSTKDVPPSYTALFFAASDSAAAKDKEMQLSQYAPTAPMDLKVTKLQPIHLKVTSNAQDELREERKQHGVLEKSSVSENNKDINPFDIDSDDDTDIFKGDSLKKEDSIPPVSLVSVDSNSGRESVPASTSVTEDSNKKVFTTSNKGIPDEDGDHNNDEGKRGMQSNLGFRGYRRF